MIGRFADEKHRHCVLSQTRDNRLYSSRFAELAHYERYVELATDAQRDLADEDDEWNSFPWLVYVLDPQDRHIAEVQYRLLSDTSILSHSRAQRKFGFRNSMDEVKNVHPYVIELGPLPFTESTATFKIE